MSDIQEVGVVRQWLVAREEHALALRGGLLKMRPDYRHGFIDPISGNHASKADSRERPSPDQAKAEVLIDLVSHLLQRLHVLLQLPNRRETPKVNDRHVSLDFLTSKGKQLLQVF